MRYTKRISVPIHLQLNHWRRERNSRGKPPRPPLKPPNRLHRERWLTSCIGLGSEPYVLDEKREWVGLYTYQRASWAPFLGGRSSWKANQLLWTGERETAEGPEGGAATVELIRLCSISQSIWGPSRPRRWWRTSIVLTQSVWSDLESIAILGN